MTETTRTQISRRTVAQGAAWTAPVILAGSIVPASAASAPPVNPSLSPRAFCKHPGNPSRYHLGIIWTNGLPCSTSITITSIVLTPFSGTPVSFVGLAPVSVGANSNVVRTYDSDETPNSANGTVRVQYTYTTCDSPPVTVAALAPLTASTLPPCQQYGIPDYGKPGHP